MRIIARTSRSRAPSRLGLLPGEEFHGTVSRRALIESHCVVAASGTSEFGDDRIREVTATTVGGERRSHDGVLVNPKFPRGQETFQQFGAPDVIHLVGTP